MKTYYAIGLMSGTSRDGLDICYAKFVLDSKWTFEILAAETIEYTADWKQKLANATIISSESLLELDTEFAQFSGEQVQEFITKHAVKQLDLIASHGHTVFHQPEKGFTLQIGDGRRIAEITNKTVVYDFRSQDVILGGQGAPLVPIGDEILFSEYDCCLNLGGFSNISFKKDEERVAYDVSPVNIVLNALAQQKGMSYDIDGKIAQNGVVNEELLTRLNKIPFYSKKYPKSLGTEWVEREITPLLQERSDSIENKMATMVEHIAIQISGHLKSHKRTLCTGGGVLNNYLMERLRHHTQGELIVPSEMILNYKEALIFALLGILRIEGQINVLKSVTGSKKNHCAGMVQIC